MDRKREKLQDGCKRMERTETTDGRRKDRRSGKGEMVGKRVARAKTGRKVSGREKGEG